MNWQGFVGAFVGSFVSSALAFWVGYLVGRGQGWRAACVEIYRRVSQ